MIRKMYVYNYPWFLATTERPLFIPFSPTYPIFLFSWPIYCALTRLPPYPPSITPPSPSPPPPPHLPVPTSSPLTDNFLGILLIKCMPHCAFQESHWSCYSWTSYCVLLHPCSCSNLSELFAPRACPPRGRSWPLHCVRNVMCHEKCRDFCCLIMALDTYFSPHNPSLPLWTRALPMGHPEMNFLRRFIP